MKKNVIYLFSNLSYFHIYCHKNVPILVIKIFQSTSVYKKINSAPSSYFRKHGIIQTLTPKEKMIPIQTNKHSFGIVMISSIANILNFIPGISLLLVSLFSHFSLS